MKPSPCLKKKVKKVKFGEGREGGGVKAAETLGTWRQISGKDKQDDAGSERTSFNT